MDAITLTYSEVWIVAKIHYTKKNTHKPNVLLTESCSTPSPHIWRNWSIQSTTQAGESV